MRFNKISNMTNGWMIGNYIPSILRTKDFEIGHHLYQKNFKAVPHTHKIATEYNYIISGRLIVSGKELKRGDIFIYEPNDVADVVFLEDTDLIIIKVPSVLGDKYLV
jgi:quercetin dioxygenase-like cupin family protein